VAEAAMQEHRNGGDRVAAVARHEISADILLADVELHLAGEPPMPLARAHVGQEDELEAAGLDRTLLEGLHAVVITARNRQAQLGHQQQASGFQERDFQPERQRLNLISARRTSSLSTIAIAASMLMRPRSFVGSKFCVNSVVK